MEKTFVVQDYDAKANLWVDWASFDTLKGGQEFLDRMLTEYDNGRFRIIERQQRVISETTTGDGTNYVRTDRNLHPDLYW